jgi:hypothetical protein
VKTVGEIRGQLAHSMLALGFFTVETGGCSACRSAASSNWASRPLAGRTANPTGARAIQARQFAWTLQEQPSYSRCLIRDREGSNTRDFDAAFRERTHPDRQDTGARAEGEPIAERFVGSVRRALARRQSAWGSDRRHSRRRPSLRQLSGTAIRAA